MKKAFKKISIICISLVTLHLSSCKDSGSPEAITELFLISMNQLDYTTMKNISTKSTRDLLKIMESQTKDKFTPEMLEQRADNFSTSIQKAVYINDSTATVTFQTKPEIIPIKQFKLIKIVEKLDKTAWKVDLSTLDLLQAKDADSNAIQSHDGQIHPDADSVAVQE